MASSDTENDVLIGAALSAGSVLNEKKITMLKHAKDVSGHMTASIYTQHRRSSDITSKHKQELTNQRSAFPQQVAENRAGPYSDFCCAICCKTLQQGMTCATFVAQQSCATKVPQQKSGVSSA